MADQDIKDREYRVHKAHCFREVDGEFMGCKYGSDDDCPYYEDYWQSVADGLPESQIYYHDMVTIAKSLQASKVLGLVDKDIWEAVSNLEHALISFEVKVVRRMGKK